LTTERSLQLALIERIMTVSRAWILPPPILMPIHFWRLLKKYSPLRREDIYFEA